MGTGVDSSTMGAIENVLVIVKKAGGGSGLVGLSGG